MNEKEKAFLKELKELLKKYNASIGFSVGKSSDTYGLYDEKMTIDVDKNNIINVDGWAFDQSDL